MKAAVFILLLIFATGSKAQQPDSNSYENNLVYFADPRIQLHDLEKFTFIFVDSSNKLSLSQIISKNSAGGFKPLPDSLEASPYVTYWLRISISAPAHIKNWWLLSGNHGYVDAWFINEDGKETDHQQTGAFIPRSKKQIKEDPSINRVYFSLQPGEKKIVYLRIYNEYGPSSISPPELRNPVIGMPEREGEIMSVISGAVFVFSILSFFFFFFVRERSYLFFGIYTLTVSLHYLILHPHFIFMDWFIPEHPFLAIPAFYTLTLGGWISFIVFGRFFINLSQLSKRLDTIFKWVIAVWIVCLITVISLMIITRRIIFLEVNYVFILLFIIFLIRISFFRSNLVRIYVAGALWLVGFSILGVLGVNTPFLNPFPIGQLGQLLIYAAGLAYKVRLDAKARAQAEAITLRNVELARLYEESTRQKEEIEVQKRNAEEALSDLKEMQSQLIQKEKMASLGELTAGIAHEIQNPLNFVNNFSDLNIELIEEMKGERRKAEGVRKPEIEDELLDDISKNLEKINHHGKRADAIVKGMLQHSRSSSGNKEPTDINALSDEYLRLSYHGLRAKDKSFNADFKTEFDDSIGDIKIIPQDMGRVMLNLYNNAFYSVNEKKKLQDVNYKPLVSVVTKRSGDKVEIIVRDNGTGIPQKVLDKIYQPFFTTKPTGQGTGLGLSMSYDIVKAHGGEIKVNTKENEGSEFIIQLPIT